MFWPGFVGNMREKGEGARRGWTLREGTEAGVGGGWGPPSDERGLTEMRELVQMPSWPEME